MSRLIDKLSQFSQSVLQPMGFRAAQPKSLRPRMLLIASLPQADIDGLADYVAGADAGLLPISRLSSGSKVLQTVSQVVPDIPWGGWLSDTKQGEPGQIVKVDCDFVILPEASALLTVLENEEVGKVLQVEASLSEGLLRAVNELPVDAVFITAKQEGDFLTLRHLMLFQRFAALLTKPLLVSVPSNVTANELQALWEAGVSGVVVVAEVGRSKQGLSELCQTIDKLTFPSQRKHHRTEALLPYISGGTDIMGEDDE